MPGVRSLPFFVLLLLTSASWTGIATSEDTSTDSTVDYEYVSMQLGGGSVTVSDTILNTAGPRFLEFIEPPEFTRTQQALENPDLVPGDKGDQGGEQDAVITERRVTDYSYMDEPWTGSARVQNVHSSEDAWLCVCDATFILQNQDGMAPTPFDRIVFIEDSSRIWIDNVTLYGGLMHFDNSEQIIVSDSLFIDSRGILTDNVPAFGRSPSSQVLVHGITMIIQRGPLNLYNHPPSEVGQVLGHEEPMCWPHTRLACIESGITIIGGEDWTVEWSHIHGNGIMGAFGAQGSHDVVLRHNTLFDTGSLSVRQGTNEISWNLVRGHSAGTNIDARGSTYTEIHNNSMIRPFKLSHGSGDHGTSAVRIINCEECILRDNDFIGYARFKDAGSSGGVGPWDVGEPALRAEENVDDGKIDATRNHWNTLHDPRVPEDVYIELRGNIEFTLDDWDILPNHPITPLVVTQDPTDVPYWAEQITGLPVQDPLQETATIGP